MRFVPQFTYGYEGDETVLALSLPQRLWEPEEGVNLGHEAIAVGGQPIGEWMRYDHAVAMVIRFTDSEYDDVLTFIEFSLRNKHRPIALVLEQGNVAGQYSVYMEKPDANARVSPRRSTETPWVWELELLFRTVDGERVHLPLLDPIVES